jgi:hypothetical protein
LPDRASLPLADNGQLAVTLPTGEYLVRFTPSAQYVDSLATANVATDDVFRLEVVLQIAQG